MDKKPNALPLFPPETQFMGPLEHDVPIQRNLSSAKRRLRYRMGFRLYCQSLISPLFSARAVFGYLVSVFALFIGILIWDDKTIDDRVNVAALGVASFIMAALIWAIALIFVTPFSVLKKERAAGEWFGARFVYHEPRRIFTLEWSPNDNGTYPLFHVPEIGPGALIDYKIEVEGAAQRLNCVVLGAYFFRPVEAVLKLAKFQLSGRVVLRKDCKLGLACFSLPDSLPAIVKVYILAWEIDPSIQMMTYRIFRTNR